MASIPLPIPAGGKYDLNAQQILAKLVSFATTSRESNLPLVNWVQDYLKHHGVNDVHLIYEPGDEDNGKAGLWATIGDRSKPGLILSGHTDTVPVDGQDWATDPYRLTLVDDNKLQGRGAVDMLGGVATALAAIPKFVSEEGNLQVPLHLALSFDEELSIRGAPFVVGWMNEKSQDDSNNLFAKPLGCIVLEPTSGEVIRKHKGKIAATITVTGEEGHSARVTGLSATHPAGELMAFISSLHQEKATDGPTDADFDGKKDPNHSTLNIAGVVGGTPWAESGTPVVNFKAGDTKVWFEIRAIPAESPRDIYKEITNFADTLLSEMREIAPGADIEFKVIGEYPGLNMQAENPFVQFVQSLVAAETSKANSGGADACYFQIMGDIPTVICGPGDVSMAHKTNEFITVDALSEGTTMMDDLLKCMTPQTSDTKVSSKFSLLLQGHTKAL